MKWSNRDVFIHLFIKPTFNEHPQCTKPCERLGTQEWQDRNAPTLTDITL